MVDKIILNTITENSEKFHPQGFEAAPNNAVLTKDEAGNVAWLNLAIGKILFGGALGIQLKDGVYNEASDASSIAVGESNVASGPENVVFGINNTVDEYSTVLGYGNQCGEGTQTTVGRNNESNEGDGVIIGVGNTTDLYKTVVVGNGNNCIADGAYLGNAKEISGDLRGALARWGALGVFDNSQSGYKTLTRKDAKKGLNFNTANDGIAGLSGTVFYKGPTESGMITIKAMANWNAGNTTLTLSPTTSTTTVFNLGAVLDAKFIVVGTEIQVQINTVNTDLYVTGSFKADFLEIF